MQVALLRGVAGFGIASLRDLSPSFGLPACLLAPYPLSPPIVGTANPNTGFAAQPVAIAWFTDPLPLWVGRSVARAPLNPWPPLSACGSKALALSLEPCGAPGPRHFRGSRSYHRSAGRSAPACPMPPFGRMDRRSTLSRVLGHAVAHTQKRGMRNPTACGLDSPASGGRLVA